MRRILYHESSMDGCVGGSHHSLLLLVKNLDPKKYEKVVIFNSDMALRPDFERFSKVIVWKGMSAVQFAGLGRTTNGKFNFLPAALAKPLDFIYRYGRNFYIDIILGAKVTKDYYSLLRRQNISLVHLNNFFEPYLTLAATFGGIPVVQHVRGIGSSTYAPLCHLPKKIICISDYIEKRVLTLGIHSEKVVRIYNAVDCRSFHPTRNPVELRLQMGISESDHMVTLFGNIQRWKGQDVLVKACIRLKRTFKRIKCVLFGEFLEEDYAREIRQQAEAGGLADSLILPGYTHEIADWMHAADIVVHASTKPEPFGRVLIEAMAVGTPVIGTKLGAVPEMIEDKETGLLYEAGKDDQLAEAIEFLLTHPAEAKRFGQKGMARVRRLFDVQEQAKQIQGIYEQVLKSG